MATASDSFSGVDLSRLPAPTIVEELDYETIRAGWLDDFAAKFPDFDRTLESDPIVKLCEVGAWRELVFRQRVNDAARAVMVAYARGADLDALAALFQVERYVLTPANPATGAAEVLESDDDFRRRIVLAPEGYSVAGPAGAYVFHALNASSLIADASATSPAPGQVEVRLLGRTGTGAVTTTPINTVAAALNADTVRPLTDQVTVRSATIINFSVDATITYRSGPDRSVVRAEAEAELRAYLERSRRIGRSITRAGITAALFVEGVQNIALALPAADIVPDATQAGYCTGIVLRDGGVAT